MAEQPGGSSLMRAVVALGGNAQPKQSRHRVVVAALLALGVSVSALPARAATNAPAAPVMVPTARPGDMRSDPNADTLPEGYVAPPAAKVLQAVAYGPGPFQIADVHLPEPGAKPAPVILYLHGGGWTIGTRNPIPQAALRQVTRMHAPVVSIEYTLATTADPATAIPAAERDIDRAIRWIKTQAPSWGAQPRVIVTGHSAGGNLALMAALAPGRFVEPDLPRELARTSPAVVGAGSFAGPVDIADMDPIEGWDPHLVPYLGCTTCTPEQVAAANPLTYATEAAPPAYLDYGADDWLIPPDVHGLPTAERLATERNEAALPTSKRAVWYEVSTDTHEMDAAHFNIRQFEKWLDTVAAGKWPGTECPKHGTRSRRTGPCPT